MSKNNLITVKELSGILNLKTSYIYKLVHQKKLKHYKPFGGKVYFKLEEIQEMIDSSVVSCTMTEEEIKDVADKYMIGR